MKPRGEFLRYAADTIDCGATAGMLYGGVRAASYPLDLLMQQNGK
jgi:hypothetical protein